MLVRNRDHADAGGLRGADAVARVLDGGAALRRYSQSPRRLEIDIGCGFPTRDFFRGDGDAEEPGQPAQLEHEVDQLAVRRRGEPERPAGGEPLDGLRGAVD